MMIKQLLKHWGTQSLQRDLKRLRNELAECNADKESLQRQVRVRDAEIENLAAVIARDRERVKAETAVVARESVED